MLISLISRSSRMPDMDIDFSQEFKQIIDAYEKSDGQKDNLINKKYASLVVSGNKVINAHNIKGIELKIIDQSESALTLEVYVEDNCKLEFPVHLCMGLLPAKGEQKIISTYKIGKNAEVSFMTHCSFPNAVDVKHIMKSEIYIGKNARMAYEETHFHGDNNGAYTNPETKAFLEEGAQFLNTFKLIKGTVGKLKVMYEAFLKKNAVTEINAKVFGKKKDDILVEEIIHLDGEGARGLAKSRIVLTDQSKSNFIGKTYGNAPHTRGHIDCTEIIKDQAQAYATPIVAVKDSSAKVTHEAAIGSVDKRQLETLMSKGLTEDEAVNIIVKGILK